MHGSRDHIVKFLVALALVLALPASAQAATIPVNTTADLVAADASCSLREAVTSANGANPAGSGCVTGDVGSDTITLPAGTYELSGAAGDNANVSGDLDVTGDTIIEGVNDGVTIIDANSLDRAIDVQNASAGGVGVDVAVRRLAIRDGLVGAGQNGGAIRVGDFDGSISIREATIADSDAGGDGGALYFHDATTFPFRTAEIVDSELRGNTAGVNGGAVSFEMTQADPPDANGLLVERSTLSHNSATTGTGGAIYAVFRALVDVVNSTLSGNSALQGGGGAVALSGSQPFLDLRFSTLANNSGSPTGAGAIQADRDGAIARILGSIIANNTPVNCAKVPTATPPFASVSLGYSIETADTCNLDAAGDLVNTNPLLQPLADNGGPTPTHHFPATSPAHNHAPCTNAPTVDQRGFPRPVPVGGLCDSGAVERIADPDGDGVSDVTDNCPDVPNAGQADIDGDRLGDACDPVDNRPVTPPPPATPPPPPPPAAPPPPPPAIVPPPPPPAPITNLAPALSSLSASPARFRPARSGSSIAARRASRGTTIRFRLSEAARVTFRLQRRAAGRRVGTSCRRATASNRTRPRCDLTLAGSFAFTGNAGANSLRFSGRLRRATLAPGRYWLRATPRDSTGKTGSTKRVAITLLRR